MKFSKSYYNSRLKMLSIILVDVMTFAMLYVGGPLTYPPDSQLHRSGGDVSVTIIVLIY